MAAMAASDDYQNERDTAVGQRNGGNKNLKEVEDLRAKIEAKDATRLLDAAAVPEDRGGGPRGGYRGRPGRALRCRRALRRVRLAQSLSSPGTGDDFRG